MIRETLGLQRNLFFSEIQCDLAIIGGGIAGVCCAITAARQGLKVTLVNDRPVLGGNSSSEVRLWILGATSHMGNNNRWAREGGVIDELLIENMYRNPEGNPIIFDTILLDKVIIEPNITLFLNTAVYNVEKFEYDSIRSVKAFCSQNQTEYEISAPMFCDASGDGIVGFLAGAAFRMGAECKDEFEENFAPSVEYGELLGHSIYFYSKDVGKPVKFIPPSFALQDIKAIPRYKNFNTQDQGCRLWWLEYGGRLDTIKDTEKIKWELWKVVYGVWNYIKNSGNFSDSENLTLEWVGMIPGKRESRRFEGDYILSQKDIIEQRSHEDAVAYGGWSIDLHPADGVFSEKPGCNQWHSKGIYQIPYRCLYSRNISNLFLTGRIISASHVAFASTRVMATSANVGQAVALAAALVVKNKLQPKDLIESSRMKVLQRELLKTGQFIPGVKLHDDEDIVQKAIITASSELSLCSLPESTIWEPIISSVAQLIPVMKGKLPKFEVYVNADEKTNIEVALKVSSRRGNFTPDIIKEEKNIEVSPGLHLIQIEFESLVEEDMYVFVCFGKNPSVKLNYSENRITGLLTVFNQKNKSVSNFGKQTPPKDIGVDEFEFWCPKRRPAGYNLAFKISPPIQAFKVNNLSNGINRPTVKTNAWVADLSDKNPHITLAWKDVQNIKKAEILFDTDFDHPMESVLMTHPERVMPFCINNYTIRDEHGKIVFQQKGNFQSINTVIFEKPIVTRKIILEMEHPSNKIPAALFSIRCYSE